MKQLALGTLGGSVLFLWFFVGWYPIADALYRHHLWPRASAQEVQEALNEHHKGTLYECDKDVAGWDYVCNGSLQLNDGSVRRTKVGGIGNPMSTIPMLVNLPVDQPTPNRDEFMTAMAEGRLRPASTSPTQAANKPSRPVVPSPSATPPPPAAVRHRPARTSRVEVKKKSGASGYTDYQLPAGSVLQAQLRTAIGSATSRVGDQVRATLSASVDRDGFELLPAGSVMHGKVVSVIPASARGPRGHIAIAFYVLEHPRTGSRASIRTRASGFDALEIASSGEPKILEKLARKPPRDVSRKGGDSFAVTLTRPLTVRIPK